MSSAQPTVTGTFAKTPLLHVLTSLLEQGLTGTLVIETTAGERSALVVDRGVPTKMRLGQACQRLSEVLIDLGWLRRDLAEASYQMAVAQGQLHGQALVDGGQLDQNVLECALRSQLVKKLQWAAALGGETVFGFYEADDYLSKWRGGTTPVGPLVAIWALARSRAEPSVVATVISRVGGHVLRLHQNANLRAFGFDRTELALLDVLRARPQTMDALVRMGLVSSHTIERMLYALTLTRHLDFGRGLIPLGVGAVSEREEALLPPKESLRPSRPVVMSAAMAPVDTLRIGREESGEFERLTVGTATAPMPTALSAIGVGAVIEPTISPKPAPATIGSSASARAQGTLSGAQKNHSERPSGTGRRISSAPPPGGAGQKLTILPAQTQIERRTQFEKLAVALGQLNHFEVLGLPRDASVATVQDVYLKLAKAYHPDRLPSEMVDLKPLATKIFAKMSEAHQTLSDPTKRTAYAVELGRGVPDDEDEKVRKVLRAAGSFQKAEVLLKKRMLAAAELEANRALEDDPDQADYLALYAWIQACKADSESRLPELCKLLSDAIARNPASEKNRYYRVQIYKRLGQVDKAVADCRIIVDKNSHHVDALREIRLWEMRRSAQKTQTSPNLGRTTSSQGHRITGARSPSDPPGGASLSGKRSDPPPPAGGLFGKLFKR